MFASRRLLASLLLPIAVPLAARAQNGGAKCAPDNAGLELPRGFCAQIVAEKVAGARHVVALPNGDLVVATRGQSGQGAGGVVTLRDTTGDGVADVQRKFHDVGGTGVAFFEDHLYFASDSDIVRWRWPRGTLAPTSPPETVVVGLHYRRAHSAKPIAIGRDGSLYVNVGAPSNSCQAEDRQARSKGQDPCPLLEVSGGIWRFDARKLHQKQSDGTRWVTGIRNIVALAMDARGETPWGVQHGRDMLADNWGFTKEKSAENPAEEMFELAKGSDFGWPYCYFDVDLKKKVLAPEYGGDGKTSGRCERVGQPAAYFPGHWAPNGLVFYTGTSFPAEYRNGAFIAFHGSWNRAPLPQAGFNVTFVPFSNGKPSGQWKVFADGFRGAEEALHRPTGITVAPDGSLIVTDDRGGRIYRIRWAG